MHDKLNSFIEQHCDLARDKDGAVRRVRGIATLSEEGASQLDAYLGTKLSDCVEPLRRGERCAARVSIIVGELLSSYDEGGVDAVLELRRLQHEQRHESQRRRIDALSPARSLNDLRNQRLTKKTTSNRK